jgi:iron(II)-dependent oxidoreductase
LVNEQDTARFIRSGESQRITTSMIGAIGDPEVARTPTQPGAPVPSQNFETTVSPQSAPQNFETTISPPPSSQGFETTVSPSTGADQSKQSGEAATEFIARVQTTAEPPKPAGDAATEFIARVQTTAEPPKPGATPSGPSAQALPGTELLPISEDRPQIRPVEPAKRQEVGKEPSPTDKPEKKEEKKEKKEKKKDAAPSPIKKPASTPAPIMKQPAVLIGAGAALAVILVLTVWKIIHGTPPPPPPPPPPTPAPIVVPQGMAYVPGGEFRLGRDGDDIKESEKPAHPVTVAPFFIDLTEVTNEQYQKFVDAKGYTPPPVWQGNHFPVDANKVPVTDVTWEDVKAYAEWLGDGKRLPTEEEWEFAARGTDGRIYPWGPEWAPNLSNSKSDENDKQRLIEVGQFPKGASPFGLLDMAGNAWEWTASDYKEYSGAQYNPPKGFKNLKVIRGGNFDSVPKSVTTTVRRPWPATRDDWAPGETPEYKDTGFRLAKDAPKQQDAPKQ